MVSAVLYSVNVALSQHIVTVSVDPMYKLTAIVGIFCASTQK